MKARINKRRVLSLVLTLAMLLPVMAAFTMTAYADEMDIRDCTGDQWLYPGEDTDAAVYLTAPADEVVLMIWRDGAWTKFKNCVRTDSSGEKWACGIYHDQAPSAKMELRFYIYYNNHTALRTSDLFFIEWTSFRGSERIAGANRFETARLIADRRRFMDGNGPYDHVIIASGNDFADALGGAYPANVLKAPILLVKNDPVVIQNTVAEIKKNLKPGGAVFILGGYGAVPEAMDNALIDAGITRIQRFKGNNRYDTNLRILEYTDYYANYGQLIICSGKDFADALSASATGLPIMLVGDKLTEAQEAYFMENDPDIYIAGGTAAVSEAVEKELSEDFGYRVERLYGANRYQTSTEIAEHFFPHQPYTVVLAYGQDFPDGLAGGPLACRTAGPLLLVDKNNYMPAEWFAYEHDPRQFFVLGGPTLIPNATVERIMNRSDLG